MLMIWAIRTMATPLQLKKKISTWKDLKVSLRAESALPVPTFVDFRQGEQYQIMLSFDFVEEQAVGRQHHSGRSGTASHAGFEDSSLLKEVNRKICSRGQVADFVQ
jgi:hypothetical protein